MCVMERCGCISLRVGVFIIAIIDLILDCADLLGCATSIVQMTGQYVREGKDDDAWVLAFLCMQILIKTIDFFVTVLLIWGVHKENVRKVQMWWWWAAGQLFGFAVIVIIYMTRTDLVTGLHIVLFAFFFALNVFCLVVVRSYIVLLQRNKLISSEVLTDEEEMEEGARTQEEEEKEEEEEELVIVNIA